MSPSRTSRQQLGDRAEDRALAYLLTQGLTLVQRNFRCRAGEIDLIMRDADSLVFVEVRHRGAGALVDALASVDYRKQRKLTRAAHFYLGRHGFQVACRFDVIGSDQSGDMVWIRNAFPAAD